MKFRLMAALLAGTALFATQVNAEAIKIGIANFGPHPVLDSVVKGFKDGMTKRGYVEGKNVVYNYTHASFKPNLLPQALAKIQAGKPKLVVTVTTPVSQAGKKMFADKGIPQVFTAVTDPIAAGLTPSWTKGGNNITGASDQQDMDGVFAFMRKLLPNAKKIGVPFNPGEANDASLVKTMEQMAPKHGFSITKVGVDKTSDIPVRTQFLMGKVDTVFILPSNLISPATPALVSVTRRHKIPVIDYSPSSTKEHQTLASYTVDWSGIGDITAGLADKILKGGSAASMAPVKPKAEAHQAYISGKRLSALGMKLPGSLAGCNCVLK
jgi:putative tryptophan/tyrosine transport system substrate-binding protein